VQAAAVKNFTTPRFWQQYHSLAPEIRKQADRCFALFQRDPQHPSLQFQKKGRAWVRALSPAIGRWRRNAPKAWCGFR
jgi:hypothetical protein